MPTELEPVLIPAHFSRLVEFLTNDEWPFHGQRELSADAVAAMNFASADVASFWITDGGATVGLLRLLDLSDISTGSPLFDVRIARDHRGHGYGTHATQWLVNHLLGSHPELHRIEATTRDDNIAMQRVLAAAGFALEGRLREAWPDDRGHRFDTLIYGILRSDWTAPRGC